MKPERRTKSAPKPMFPIWVRLWHWINVALFAVLGITGFSLHFAGGSLAPVSFRVAVITHNTAGLLAILNYSLYVVNLLVTRQWRQYVPEIRGMVSRMRGQLTYYLGGIFRGAPHPFHATPDHRFNPMQQLTYLATMFIAFPLLAGTGLFMLFPGAAPERVAGLGGVWPMALAHTLMAYAFMSFLIVHLYLALTAAEPSSGLKAMVYGTTEDTTPIHGRAKSPG